MCIGYISLDLLHTVLSREDILDTPQLKLVMSRCIEMGLQLLDERVGLSFITLCVKNTHETVFTRVIDIRCISRNTRTLFKLIGFIGKRTCVFSELLNAALEIIGGHHM